MMRTKNVLLVLVALTLMFQMGGILSAPISPAGVRSAYAQGNSREERLIPELGPQELILPGKPIPPEKPKKPTATPETPTATQPPTDTQPVSPEPLTVTPEPPISSGGRSM